MKRLATISAILAALVLCTTALASSALSGTYNATITKAGSLNGAWSLAFSGSNYTISFKGAAAVKGTFTQGGNKITFSDKSGKYACPAKGVYTYSLIARTLTFKSVSDSKCTGRRTVLAARFTKKFSSSGGGSY
jgi:hypothetical protein